MESLTLEEFKKIAEKSAKIAVFEEIEANDLTPTQIYQLLNERAPEEEGAMFEHLLDQDALEQDFQDKEANVKDALSYSYICFESLQSLSIGNRSTTNVIEALRELKTSFQYETREEVASLITKAIGIITYDAASAFENITYPNVTEHKIKNEHTINDSNSLPLALFHFYAVSITFDHRNKKILISTLAEVQDDVENAYYQARKKIEEIITQLSSSPSTKDMKETFPSKNSNTEVSVDISDADFMHLVRQAKEYIIRGDAFQVVLSRCFRRQFTASPFVIYEHLRKVSPAPFMFYFPTKTAIIIGASPERLVCIKENEVTVNPIAGTRKRTNDKSNEVISNDLLNDKKELAEHMMLVDLARNDVGRISRPGSVEVSAFLQVKHYSHVSHITSTVKGLLQKQYDVLDALKATIPAGTLSGAPKIRAMQIIADLEKSPRGLYGGAVCRFDLSDNFDSCIAIRMAVLQDGIATLRTGAGIVFDSDPAKEAQETYQKAYGVLAAIAQAHGEPMT